ncbi:phosphotransferase [Actinosynnema pretiosum subsp. pretiosum]|uniref:Phosphotransferase n=1 Tax=Actinosynnema pretiosum subsp. pretiosum TaxID=103721 RepID=A0AA45LDM4_9PSEU|nr:phosphotransferase [Actinosynnema pretiosum subsp. pretiosum]
MTRSELRALFASAVELGLPVDDPVVLKDGSNVLVLLRPAPVVARVGAVTAAVRGDVAGHFRRADAVSRHLAARGVPVVEPLVGPVERDGHAVAFARHVPHRPGALPAAELATLLGGLHAALRDHDGELPVRGPLDDVDAALALLGWPPEQAERRAGLVARLPDVPVRPLHGDAHAGNVLLTDAGPVWNDFEDAWLGPPAWDLVCGGLTGTGGAGTDLVGTYLAAAADVAAEEVAPEVLARFAELRALQADCWRAAARLVHERRAAPADRERARPAAAQHDAPAHRS